jgi:hypothetical protein
MIISRKWTAFLKIASTAILTAILTLVSSWFLLYRQLSKEQEYWTKRAKIERLQNLSATQIKLFEEINKMILDCELLAKEVKLDQVEFATRLTGPKSIRESKDLITGKQLQEKIIGYHHRLYELGSKLQMAGIYFGNAVDKPIKELGKALEKNYMNNSIMNVPIEKQTLVDVLEYYKKDFGPMEILEKNRTVLLDSMSRQIALVVRTMNEN